MSSSEELEIIPLMGGVMRVRPLRNNERGGPTYTFADGSHLGRKPDVLKMAERDLVQIIGKYRTAVGPDVLADLDRALEKVRWRLAETPRPR